LQQHEEYHGGAVFWSPRAMREARTRMSVRAAEEERLQLQKADAAALRASNKLLKKKLADEKKVQKDKEKAERDRMKAEQEAEKEAARAAKTATQNTKTAIQTSQKGKRKASQSSQPKAKRVRRTGDDRVGGRWHEAASAAPPRISQRGRSTKPRRIFE
jgi:beta-glucosidase-like glycosyl hydrolase